MQKPWRQAIKPPAPYCATSCFPTKTIVISLCDKYTLLFEKSQTSVKSTVMFCFFITVCILALAGTADNQAAYQVVNTQSLPILESPPRDLQRSLQSPPRSTINRLRNNGSGNLNLPSPVTVTESLPIKQLFIPHIEIYSPDYGTFTDVARYSAAQDAQSNDNANDNIYLEKRRPLVIINGSPQNQKQHGTEDIPGTNNRPDVLNANFNNAKYPSLNNFKNDEPPVIYEEKSQTNENHSIPLRKGQQTNRKINNVNKTNVHEGGDNIENDKVDFESDKPAQKTKIQPSVTSKPSDIQLVNATDIVNVTLGQRASFDGDKCPTGHIRVNGSTQCIPTD